jgi:nicotinate-nucleotide pyrophosphorylase (carboxylating)
MQPNLIEVQRIIHAALIEDIGRGDMTSQTLVSSTQKANAVMIAKEEMVVCGLAIIPVLFETLDSKVDAKILVKEGDPVSANTPLVQLEGNARGLLAGERTMLNLIQRMCGIATKTSEYIKLMNNPNCTLLDTRKTAPGLRELDKYAVRAGGGSNHRFRLDDGVLIKDNHIALSGGIKVAISKAQQFTPFLTKIEIECENLKQVQEALHEGVDTILLDNMDAATLKEVVKLVAGKVKLEASGNINRDTIADVAATGVDYISVGRLTHSVKAADISLEITFQYAKIAKQASTE